MSSSSSESRPSDQQLVATFQQMRQELASMAQKIGELEMENEEHTLVIDTLKPVEGSRKCFRLVGGVLVERTVKDVLPALVSNQEGIDTVLKSLMETYKKKDQALRDFQTKYNIRIRGDAPAEQSTKAASSGVLV